MPQPAPEASFTHGGHFDFPPLRSPLHVHVHPCPKSQLGSTALTIVGHGTSATTQPPSGPATHLSPPTLLGQCNGNGFLCLQNVSPWNATFEPTPWQKVLPRDHSDTSSAGEACSGTCGIDTFAINQGMPIHWLQSALYNGTCGIDTFAIDCGIDTFAIDQGLPIHWPQSALYNGTCGIIWLQSAHNPDAAKALLLDHLRRRGKRKNWVRYELYWNYLFSNKNCARVWSAWIGMVWPFQLCLAFVGFLCLACFLLTIGNQFAYQTMSSLMILKAWYGLRHYGTNAKLLIINLGIQIKWMFDWYFCLAPAAFAICGIILLVAWGIAIYNFVRSLLYFVTCACLVAFEAITSTTVKTVCFIWTPITTTISVGCPYAIVFVSGYRDFLRKLLDFASPTVRDHYSSDVCEPCDGCSMDMPSASRGSYHPWIYVSPVCTADRCMVAESPSTIDAQLAIPLSPTQSYAAIRQVRVRFWLPVRCRHSCASS